MTCTDPRSTSRGPPSWRPSGARSGTSSTGRGTSSPASPIPLQRCARRSNGRPACGTGSQLSNPVARLTARSRPSRTARQPVGRQEPDRTFSSAVVCAIKACLISGGSERCRSSSPSQCCVPSSVKHNDSETPPKDRAHDGLATTSGRAGGDDGSAAPFGRTWASATTVARPQSLRRR